ncbi:DNA repair protein RecN [Acaryochloris marina]|uniref:DNA repair protein RecN n=1 Tax=Acaryochloris marina (strain MBIC 11017) TaxID=329726 RepID=B0C985_ACAM1|nr:DNA repair protein RecN [Acaryochloris marina]ABW27766.1 DNA repair protein RecN [Acaryochloris marina MBIC11017]BDM82495.1 DNA repair protein RecN [Acaryochloris marina MBIC10699]
MLLSLRIENFALIDTLDLTFTDGLNVLTGETGAGKSILLDAIDLILGGKALSSMLRTGESRTLLEASFSLTPNLNTWLADTDIDPLDDLLVCSREISTQNTLRSRFRVNGVVVNKQQVAQLREQLIEVTAQGQAVQLGRADRQRQCLDGFGGEPLLKQRQQVTKAFARWQNITTELNTFRQNEQQRLQNIDLLRYQLQELDAANLSDPNEQTNLEQELQRLSHSVELEQQSYQVYQLLYEQDQGDACGDLLGQAESVLIDMSQYDSQLEPILELVQQALTQVQEAGSLINAYGNTVETDPEQLQSVEARLMELKQICRKYGPSLEDAIAHHQTIQSQYADLTGEGQSLEELEQTAAEYKAKLQQACAKLTALRQKAAQQLESRILQELKPLALDKVQFQVGLQSISPTQHGADQIQFLFSANPGEALQPLSESASGGEMSRFLLALKACFSQGEGVGTLIFDEIDAGVSGHVAQAIATKLYHLSQNHQVLCVTHQPMIAAMADAHFQVQKQVVMQGAKSARTKTAERTVVQVTSLDDQQRRQELAEIAGGQTTQQALTFVDSLLQQAGQVRQSYANGKTATQSKKAKKRAVNSA